MLTAGVFVTALLLAGCGAHTASNPMGDGGVSAFYTLGHEPPAKPGSMIRTELLPDELVLENAAQGRRILYSSTDGLDGRSPVPVSGAMFLPKGTAPPDGWPLIAWAHGTVGVADVCAPSWEGRSERDDDYLNSWLAQGYAIVATDYQGLGVPGGHPYLATRAEAYSVLYSVRAVQSGNDPISKKVVIVGQSQGGGAAIASAGTASEYAPELDISGTVAVGTPYFAPGATPIERGVPVTGEHLAYEMLMLYLAQRADPSFRPDDHVAPAAMSTVRLARDHCLQDISEAATDARLTADTTFTGGVDTVLGPYYPLMAYHTLTLKGPVFMGAGGVDTTVPPEGQQRLAEDACAAGSTVEFHVYPDQGHSATINESLPDAIPFVKKAFAEEPIPGNCAS